QAAGQVPEPTDADLAAFYEANKERYTAPEYRRVTAVLLRPEDLAAEMRVSEERLREAYDSRQAEFRTPESRGVSQLLFTEEAAARSAYERIAAGESFDAVAADIPSAQRTDLGTVHPGDLFPEAVDQAVFALPAPGVTEPVQSPLGWHLLNVSEITPAATIPFEQAQERLRQ